jgi:hypothetical protein
VLEQTDVLTLVVQNLKFVKSKTEAKKILKSGGIKLNYQAAPTEMREAERKPRNFESSDLLYGRFLTV